MVHQAEILLYLLESFFAHLPYFSAILEEHLYRNGKCKKKYRFSKNIWLNLLIFYL